MIECRLDGPAVELTEKILQMVHIPTTAKYDMMTMIHV